MTGFEGADVAALRRLARLMGQRSSELTQLVGRLSTSLHDTQSWRGPDADAFRHEWTGRLAPATVKASRCLHEASQVLAKNADEQDQASSPDGAVGIAGGVVGQFSGLLGSVDPDRRGTERETRNSRRGRGDHGHDSGGSTPGPPGYKNGLGKPVSGEHVDKPEPPAWHGDPDSEKHGSKDAGLKDHALKLTVEAAANAATPFIPHASRNLLHYLGNSGKPLEQDVDQMLSDDPNFRGHTTQAADNLALRAVADAKSRGVTGPVTYPISTGWMPYTFGQDSQKDWFYATGSMSYGEQGQVTVYPPDHPGGEWRYSSDTSVSYRDRYNWDSNQGKSTTIGPFNVSDKSLGELNKAGLAHNFDMVGTSSDHHSTGEVK